MIEKEVLWRLVDSGALEGPANMALDEALLESFVAGGARPVLRLYGWSPASLSVGRYQDVPASLNLPLCHAAQLPVVRRITGGGIIYHHQELTYSIVCSPAQIGQVSGVKDAFKRLCAFLLMAYRSLGLDAAFAVDVKGEGERLGEPTPFCFAGREPYDIVVCGKKLGGNAQRRKREVIFQHGSIPLQSCVREAVRYLRQPAPEAEQATSLDALGVEVPLHVLKSSLCAAFEESLRIRLSPDCLSATETAGAERLLKEKYSSPEWNLAGES